MPLESGVSLGPYTIGSRLGAGGMGDGTGWDLWTWAFTDRKAQIFLRTPFNEVGPRFSPDWAAALRK